MPGNSMDYCHRVNGYRISRRIKVFLIIYLILSSQSLKMTSSKPKYVAMFDYIVHIINLC